MSWASRRKALYASMIGGFLLVTVGIPAYLWFDQPPNCFDGVLNGEELGIDCGGTCELMCPFQIAPLSVAWSRAFKVSNGYYNVIAYLENPNFGSYARALPYRFELYDKDNVLIDVREGATFVTNNGAVPVFEAGIITGVREPARTFFKVLSTPSWYRSGSAPVVRVESEKVVTPSGSPRVEATIRNDEPYELYDVEVAVIVYDLSGNAMATSRTIIDMLLPRERLPVFFTWPIPFPDRVGRIEIIPRIPPQEEA